MYTPVHIQAFSHIDTYVLFVCVGVCGCGCLFVVCLLCVWCVNADGLDFEMYNTSMKRR